MKIIRPQIRTYAFIAGLTFLMDLLTKQWAYFFLPFEKEVYVLGNHLYLFLTLNTGVSGSKLQSLLAPSDHINVKLVMTGLAGFVLGTYILWCPQWRVSFARKVVFGVLLQFLLGFVIEETYSFIDLPIPNHFASWFPTTGALFMYGALVYVIDDRLTRILLALIIGGGLGNLMNHFYPPFHVIDFICSDLLSQWLHLGIFNLSDLVIDLSQLSLVGYLLYLLGRRIVRSVRKPKNLEPA